MRDIKTLYKAILDHIDPTSYAPAPVSAYSAIYKIQNKTVCASVPGDICAKVLGRKMKLRNDLTLYFQNSNGKRADAIYWGNNLVWNSGALEFRNLACQLFGDIKLSGQLWRDMRRVYLREDRPNAS